MSLRQIAIGSIAVSSVGILRILSQILVIPILVRHLSPTDYGIMALTMPFILFAMAFSDAGMSNSLIRKKERDEIEWSTGFWLCSALGLCLSILICGIGYLLSIFMGEPILTSVVAFLSLCIFFQSIATVPGASIQQEHRFSLLALIEIISMISSLTSAVFTAIYGGGIWALVVQQIVHFSIKLILTCYLSPFKPMIVFTPTSIKDHLAFGRDMLINNTIFSVRASVGNLLIGKVTSAHTLGIFSMASMFAELFYKVISGPVQMVAYPRMSSIKEHRDQLKTFFLFMTRIIAITVIPIIGMIAAAHKPVFSILLTDKWEQAGYIFMIMAAGSALQAATALRNTVAMAMGRTDIILKQSIESSVLWLLAIAFGAFWGLEWIAAGIMIITFLYFPRSIYLIFKLIDLPINLYLAALITPTIVTLFSICSYIILANISGWGTIALFFSAIFLGITAFFMSIICQYKPLKEQLRLVKSIAFD